MSITSTVSDLKKKIYEEYPDKEQFIKKVKNIFKKKITLIFAGHVLEDNKSLKETFEKVKEIY
jgi:hypothetical protein